MKKIWIEKLLNFCLIVYFIPNGMLKNVAGLQRSKLKRLDQKSWNKVLVDDRKILGMESADPQNCS